MTINLIIISYNNSDLSYVNQIKGYNLATEENTNVIFPTEEVSEISLLTPLLKEDMDNLIIYEWSFTYKDNISTTVTNLLAYEYDFLYLGKFLDTCSHYSLESNIENFSLVSGTSPIGFNAVLIKSAFIPNLIANINANTYRTLNYALSYIMITEEVVVKAVSPNLFVYSPLYNYIDNSKAFSSKSQECQPVTSQIAPPSDNNLTIFWILIIIIVVAILFIITINWNSLFVEYQGNSIEL